MEDGGGYQSEVRLNIYIFALEIFDTCCQISQLFTIGRDKFHAQTLNVKRQSSITELRLMFQESCGSESGSRGQGPIRGQEARLGVYSSQDSLPDSPYSSQSLDSHASNGHGELSSIVGGLRRILCFSSIMQHALLLLGKVRMSYNFVNFLMNYLEIFKYFQSVQTNSKCSILNSYWVSAWVHFH